MSISFGMTDLENHIRNILTTTFIKKALPISTLIVAPPERDKSNTVIKFRGNTILTLSDFTAYGLMKELEKYTKRGKCQISHVLIPDLTRITARSRSVRKEIVATLQILASEGIKEIHTYNVNVEFKEPLKIGVIACITRSDLCDHRTVWSKIGFLSRFIPFSFDYDELMKINILKFISQDKQLKKEQITVSKRRSTHVIVPKEIQLKLQENARAMSNNIERFCGTPLKDRIFGARALHQLSTYIKAIALRNNETIVNDSHYGQLQRLFYYFNYDALPILPRERKEVVSNGKNK